MSNAITVENKAAVRTFYDRAVHGDFSAFASSLHAGFICSAPRYLPWGGVTYGAAAYLSDVLPRVTRVLDFGRSSCDSITAEDDRVVALVDVGVMDTNSTIRLSQHWTLDGGRVRAIWTAYFEPAALLARLECEW